ncbi:MAG: TonB-dependent receptor plug domain-containing protein [Gammaproteobacteria bacterium]
MLRDSSVWILAGILLTGVPAPADAGDDPTDSIVVTASRLGRQVDELSQTVAVLTRDDIQRLNAASATEALRQIPGTNVIQQGGRGGVTSILLRGGEPNFTVVLIDGVQVNDPTNTRGGSFDVGGLEQSQIARVETIFGAMSPMYGSDALSGVVNFLTRGAESGSDLGVEIGTEGYGSASGFYGATFDGVDVGLGAYYTNDDGAVDGSDYSAGGLHGKFAAEFAGSGTAALSLGFQNAERNSFPEDSGGPDLAVIRAVDSGDVNEARAGLDVGYVFADRWRADLWASIYRREEEAASPGIAPGVLNGVPPNAADTDFDRSQLRATIATEFPANVTVLAGVEWRNESGESDGIIDFGVPVPTDFDLDRDTISAFAEAAIDVGNFSLQGGLRRDDPDLINSVTTGRLGLLYRFGDGKTQLRANWGEGFKAPSFFALAHPIVGNPNLRSETGDTVDVGIKRNFDLGNGSFEFVIFRNDYEDLIDFDSNLFTNVNRDNVVTKGAEFAIDFAPGERFNVRAHLTYLDTDVKDSDVILRGRPEWRGGAVVDWEILPQWRWVTSFLALDDFYESSVPTGGVWLDGHTRVDTAVTWQANESLSIGLAVDNLFDEDYHEAVGFPAAGIRGRIGARYRF